MISNKLWTLALCIFLTGSAVQAQSRSGISVKATGQVKLKPDVLELEGHVNGNAELAADAITKFRSNRQRAVEALEALQIPNLKISAGRVELTSALDQAAQQAMRRGMAVTGSTNRPLDVSEPLSIRIDGIDKLTQDQVIETLVKILDAGKDAGVTLGAKDQPGYNPYTGQYNSGGTALARFRLSDVESARQKAFEDAMTNAQKQGERLAKLAGLKLGKVRAINESTANQTARQQVNVVYAYMPPNQEQEAELFTSPSLQDITVSAVIEVDFDVINIARPEAGLTPDKFQPEPAKKPVPSDEFEPKPAKKPVPDKEV